MPHQNVVNAVPHFTTWLLPCALEISFFSYQVLITVKPFTAQKIKSTLPAFLTLPTPRLPSGTLHSTLLRSNWLVLTLKSPTTYTTSFLHTELILWGAISRGIQLCTLIHFITLPLNIVRTTSIQPQTIPKLIAFQHYQEFLQAAAIAEFQRMPTPSFLNTGSSPAGTGLPDTFTKPSSSTNANNTYIKMT